MTRKYNILLILNAKHTNYKYPWIELIQFSVYKNTNIIMVNLKIYKNKLLKTKI